MRVVGVAHLAVVDLDDAVGIGTNLLLIIGEGIEGEGAVSGVLHGLEDLTLGVDELEGELAIRHGTVGDLRTTQVALAGGAGGVIGVRELGGRVVARRRGEVALAVVRYRHGDVDDLAIVGVARLVVIYLADGVGEGLLIVGSGHACIDIGRRSINGRVVNLDGICDLIAVRVVLVLLARIVGRSCHGDGITTRNAIGEKLNGYRLCLTAVDIRGDSDLRCLVRGRGLHIGNGVLDGIKAHRTRGVVSLGLENIAVLVLEFEGELLISERTTSKRLHGMERDIAGGVVRIVEGRLITIAGFGLHGAVAVVGDGHRNIDGAVVVGIPGITRVNLGNAVTIHARGRVGDVTEGNVA